MSYRYVDANDVVDIVDIETQNKINEMDCVYIDGIKPDNQHFNLIDHDKRIRDEVVEQLQKDTSITLRTLATELMKNQKNYSEDTCHYFSKGIQAFVIHIEKFIAEQKKGEQNG